MEFALVLPILVALFICGFDFARCYVQLQQLNTAMTAAAQYAFVQGQLVVKQPQSEASNILTNSIYNFTIALLAQQNLSAGLVTGQNPNVVYDFTPSPAFPPYPCYCWNGVSGQQIGQTTCGTSCAGLPGFAAGDTSTSGKWITMSVIWFYTPVIPISRVPYYNFVFRPVFFQRIAVRIQ